MKHPISRKIAITHSVLQISCTSLHSSPESGFSLFRLTSVGLSTVAVLAQTLQRVLLQTNARLFTSFVRMM